MGREGDLRVALGALESCALARVPGEEGRPRGQPLAAEGLTACQDGEGWGVWGERAGVWVERSEQTQPPKPGPRNAGRGETAPSADGSCPGLARAGHSPTAQWLPRGYILASTVSPAAGTGAAGARGAWQRTSASRTSGSSRARMVPTGSSRSAPSAGRRVRFPSRGATAGRGPRGAPPSSSAPLLQPSPSPTLYGSPVGGVGGSSTADRSALTSPYSEPGRLDNRP